MEAGIEELRRLQRAEEAVARHRVIRFESGDWLEAVAFASCGGMGLVTWFRDRSGDYAIARLVGFDRQAMIALGRRWGIGCPVIYEGGAACWIELWGRPAAAAVREAEPFPQGAA